MDKSISSDATIVPNLWVIDRWRQLASKIILSASDEYIMYFTGCLVLVVPFFFVPVILKGSFAAMGNIGAKVSGFGRTLGQRGRNRLDSTIKNSDAYKNRVQYNQRYGS